MDSQEKIELDAWDLGDAMDSYCHGRFPGHVPEPLRQALDAYFNMEGDGTLTLEEDAELLALWRAAKS